MNTPLFQALNESQTRLSSPSDHRGGDNASKASRPPPPGLVDLRMEPTDDDSYLIVLGKQFRGDHNQDPRIVRTGIPERPSQAN